MRSFGRTGLMPFARDNASWLAPGLMLAAIACNEIIRLALGDSPPAFILFSVALLYAGLSGLRIGVTSAALLCAYLLFLTIIGAGDPLLTGNFLQFFLAAVAILAIAFGLGRTMDRNRALIEDFERTDAELKKSRDELEKRVEDATTELRVSEARLKKAQRVGRIGSWERNLETGAVWWSDELFRVHGRSGETAAPSYAEFIEQILPGDRPRVVEAMRATWETGVPASFEFRIGMPDGSAKTILSFIELSRSTEGKNQFINGIAQDISRIREADERIRRSEARLREAQRVARIGSIERNLDSDEIWWSTETFRIFGMEPTAETASIERFRECLHPDDRKRVVELVTSTIASGSKLDTQYRIVRPDGEVRVLHAIAEVSFDREGKPTRLTGTLQDITERIALEREVVAISERERNRIGRDLHDGLGQDLTGISLALRTLSRQLVREKSPHVEQIGAITSMVQNTISETRGFARQLAPSFLLEQGLCAALRSLAGEISELSTATCIANNHYKGEIRDPEVATNFYRIAQEGISNALKHGSAANIELNYGRDTDSLYLEILDDGIGMPTSADYAEGMGIRGMRFRAHMLRGRFDIGPRATGGTRIRVSCPYRFH